MKERFFVPTSQYEVVINMHVFDHLNRKKLPIRTKLPIY
jgi:2-polyprenyl-3-methyl-5-hydroxy-6-metoxy-1,4-benzoquinol methylase